jgi:hypothetical protein
VRAASPFAIACEAPSWPLFGNTDRDGDGVDDGDSEGDGDYDHDAAPCFADVQVRGSLSAL